MPVTGVYRFDDGVTAATCACELALAASAGAAFTPIPAEVATSAVATRNLTGLLLENFHEILNICAQLLNDQVTTHVTLSDVGTDRTLSTHAAFGPDHPSTIWLDLDIAIAGYGGGRLVLRGLTPA